jgi:hypothetical protein
VLRRRRLQSGSDENRIDVLIIARPEQLIDTAARAVTKAAGRDGVVDATADSGSRPALPRFANFHDMLKARVLQIRQPIQIIRRSTWDESAPPPTGRSRQDEATRARNLHVALYYKAGGVPWRLPRNSADLTTCYVGVAFYRNDDDITLDTSVAQVFNERGDGVIVCGGPGSGRRGCRPGTSRPVPRAATDSCRPVHGGRLLTIARQRGYRQSAARRTGG